jgi:micrococcal nuclease
MGVIAEKVGVTIDSLINANHLTDPNALFVGQEITVVSEDGPTITPEGPHADALVRVQVISVTNVHTVRVRLPDGTEATVRYIGVDAPDEASGFAAEATARNTELVDGRFVFLEAEGADRDEFNRLLRYVWIEESNIRLTLVNAALVAFGLAGVTSPPSEARYHDLLLELQDAAQIAGLRIWSNRP